MGLKKLFQAVVTLMLVPSLCRALLTPNTLPEGISSPTLRFGFITNLNEKYDPQGSLHLLGDLKSVVLDTPTLKNINPDITKLITALNAFGGNGLGDKLTLGTLRVHSDPRVSYIAPIFAHGVTSSWTLALGLPVVSYSNKISFSHENSNLNYYQRQFKGLNSELDAAFELDVVQETKKLFAEKGYKDLSERTESFLGDIQIASIAKLYDNGSSQVIYFASLGLPTGPQFNADDLAALTVFGRTSLSNTLAYSYKFPILFTFMPYLTYSYTLPDRITARVPQDEQDSLPDASSAQSVHRHIGDSVGAGFNAFYDISDRWVLGFSLERFKKSADHYQGAPFTRVDLLSLGTEAEADRVKWEITYTSVNSYLQKKSFLPMMASLEVSDVLAGKNTERQTVQELSIMLFF